MKTVFLCILSIFCIASGLVVAQEHSGSSIGNNLRIQKLVRDVIGRTIVLNFKGEGPKTGTLIRANGNEFVLEVEGDEEIFQTQTIHSYTIKAGIAEGILMVISGCFGAGLGAGAAALSVNGISAAAVGGVGFVFGILGGWLGYESFFQDVEVELP